MLPTLSSLCISTPISVPGAESSAGSSAGSSAESSPGDSVHIPFFPLYKVENSHVESELRYFQRCMKLYIKFAIDNKPMDLAKLNQVILDRSMQMRMKIRGEYSGHGIFDYTPVNTIYDVYHRMYETVVFFERHHSGSSWLYAYQMHLLWWTHFTLKASIRVKTDVKNAIYLCFERLSPRISSSELAEYNGEFVNYLMDTRERPMEIFFNIKLETDLEEFFSFRLHRIRLRWRRVHTYADVIAVYMLLFTEVQFRPGNQGYKMARDEFEEGQVLEEEQRQQDVKRQRKEAMMARVLELDWRRYGL
jgi:hypothetical protein